MSANIKQIRAMLERTGNTNLLQKQDVDLEKERLQLEATIKGSDSIKAVGPSLPSNMDDELNKAADELALRAFPEKKSYSSVYDRVVDYNAVDRKNYRDGILAGAELMKKQMMEEAEEVKVGMHGEPIEITLDKYVQRAMGIYPGGKVRIIVIPNTDEK